MIDQSARSPLVTSRRRARRPGEPLSPGWGFLAAGLLVLAVSVLVFLTVPGRPLARLERALSAGEGRGDTR